MDRPPALRAVILAKLFRDDEAFPELQSINAIDSGFIEVNQMLASILMARGQDDLAGEVLRKGAETTPDDERAQQLLREFMAHKPEN